MGNAVTVVPSRWSGATVLFAASKPFRILVAAAVVVLGIVGSVPAVAAQDQPVSAIGGQAGLAQAGQTRPVVYFTFDDGPDGVVTGRILDTLDQYGARATFFVTGSRINGYASVVRRIVDEGHAIANHSYNHPQLTSLSDAGVLSQFTNTNSAIRQATGVQPSCYRPPYGAVNARVHALAVQAGLPNAQWTTGNGNHYGLWDIDTVDWRLQYSRTWYELSKVSAGDVVLMHSLKSFSADIFAQWMAANAHRFDFQPLPGCGAGAEPPTPADPAYWYRYQVARLYSAYFDRPPDYNGAKYWNTLYAHGRLNLVEISDNFALSAEFARRHADLTNRDFVEVIYRHVLKRPPDGSGLDYWTDLLDRGRISRGELMVQFSESSEFVRLAAPQVTGPAWTGEAQSSYQRGIDLNVLPGPDD